MPVSCCPRSSVEIQGNLRTSHTVLGPAGTRTGGETTLLCRPMRRWCARGARAWRTGMRLRRRDTRTMTLVAWWSHALRAGGAACCSGSCYACQCHSKKSALPVRTTLGALACVSSGETVTRNLSLSPRSAPGASRGIFAGVPEVPAARHRRSNRALWPGSMRLPGSGGLPSALSQRASACLSPVDHRRPPFLRAEPGTQALLQLLAIVCACQHARGRARPGCSEE
jgi:hypothetical protein